MKETITYVFNNSWESFKDYMKPTRPNFEMSLPFKFWNNLGNVPFNKTYLKTETSQSQECLGQATITHTKAESQMTEVIEMHVFETFWCPRCSPKTIKKIFFLNIYSLSFLGINTRSKDTKVKILRNTYVIN